MTKIQLNYGLFATVDDEDAAKLLPFEWYVYLLPTNGGERACVMGYVNGRLMKMDRVIMGVFDGTAKRVYHQNSDPLDCRKENLYVIDPMKSFKQPKTHGVSSHYRGVYLYKRENKFMARITHNGKRKYLGLYDDERKAAEAYNAEAAKLGLLRRLNYLGSEE